MAEAMGNLSEMVAEARRDAAKNMTRDQLNYYTAIVKGKPEYDNADNVAEKAETLPAGIDKAPTKVQAFDAIESDAKGGNAAAMMRMGDLYRNGVGTPQIYGSGKENLGDHEFRRANPEKSIDYLNQAHVALEATMHDPAKAAEQKADANWDMSAVHYYNSTLPEGKRADLKLPEGVKTPEEADLYYTTLAARTDTNHRYGEWVERVQEGTEYEMPKARQAEIMDKANAVELGDAKPYVSTAESRAELLEKIRDGKTNPADPVDEKFDEKMKDKLERLERVDPKTPMSLLDKVDAAMEGKETSQSASQTPSQLVAQQVEQSSGRFA